MPATGGIATQNKIIIKSNSVSSARPPPLVLCHPLRTGANNNWNYIHWQRYGCQFIGPKYKNRLFVVVLQRPTTQPQSILICNVLLPVPFVHSSSHPSTATPGSGWWWFSAGACALHCMRHGGALGSLMDRNRIRCKSCTSKFSPASPLPLLLWYFNSAGNARTGVELKTATKSTLTSRGVRTNLCAGWCWYVVRPIGLSGRVLVWFG